MSCTSQEVQLTITHFLEGVSLNTGLDSPLALNVGLERRTGLSNWNVGLEYGAGIVAILAPKPMLAGT